MKRAAGSFDVRTLDELAIDDARSFRHVALYGDLAQVVRRAGVAFRVLPKASRGRADRALLLNLTFWTPASGGDVLAAPRIPADVVTHVAWHHLAAGAFASRAAPASEALLFGEAIASAFDVYLVGRLLGHAPRSTFLATQVSAMAETASAAGLSSRGFERLLAGAARDPEGAFARLRELLFDVSTALYACRTAEQAHAVLQSAADRPFGPLLHRYELSNWVLYARAHGSGRDRRVRAVDRSLRTAASPLAWLERRWVAPALR